MLLRELHVQGALELTPTQHRDDRGVFMEWFRADAVGGAIGHGVDVAQANLSVSARGVLRGVHFADVPPGQAKYVTCVTGSVLDVVVDLRVGSPTFGVADAVLLDADERRAVYLPVGVGHAFLSLQDASTVVYLCSEVYRPGAEHGIHPLDPALGVTWPADIAPLLSEKDAAAPSLAEAAAQGLLPTYLDCQAHAAELRARTVH